MLNNIHGRIDYINLFLQRKAPNINIHDFAVDTLRKDIIIFITYEEVQNNNKNSYYSFDLITQDRWSDFYKSNQLKEYTYKFVCIDHSQQVAFLVLKNDNRYVGTNGKQDTKKEEKVETKIEQVVETKQPEVSSEEKTIKIEIKPEEVKVNPMDNVNFVDKQSVDEKKAEEERMKRQFLGGINPPELKDKEDEHKKRKSRKE